MYGAFIASLGVVALVFSSNVTFAGSPAVRVGGAASTHPVFRPLGARSLQHNRRRDRDNVGAVWWPGDSFDGSSYSEPGAGVVPPGLGGDNNTRYTYTYDVPWDAIHRFPPMVAPSDKPYVSACPTETVTVPGRSGKEQDVNITRCY
jgi:hypothetical protein